MLLKHLYMCHPNVCTTSLPICIVYSNRHQCYPEAHCSSVRTSLIYSVKNLCKRTIAALTEVKMPCSQTFCQLHCKILHNTITADISTQPPTTANSVIHAISNICHTQSHYTVFHKKTSASISYIFAKLWTIFIKKLQSLVYSQCALLYSHEPDKVHE